MTDMPRRPTLRRQPSVGEYCRGFTYVGVLILIAILGLVSGATVQLGSLLQRRAAEDELLVIGLAYRTALVSYANATPAGQSRYPRSLQDLLQDPRHPDVRRHLRRVYADPITGNEEWGMVKSPDGVGIIGIHSQSDAVPIKIGNFTSVFQDFTGKLSYRAWVFFGPLQ